MTQEPEKPGAHISPSGSSIGAGAAMTAGLSEERKQELAEGIKRAITPEMQRRLREGQRATQDFLGKPLCPSPDLSFLKDIELISPEERSKPLIEAVRAEERAKAELEAMRRDERHRNEIEDMRAQSRAANPQSRKKDSALTPFPTPPDATWDDVRIRFKNGHTVSIRVKSESGVFNYTQMGMANKKNTDPTVQWGLLWVFAEKHGVLDWSSTSAHPHNQKRRERLATNLRRFFGIEGDPFRLTDDRKGWQANFHISPDK